MAMRAISWPKLIGAFVVAVGIALSLKAAEFTFMITMTDLFDPLSSGWPLVVAAVGSVGSIVVGLAAYSAHEWARRTLIAVTAVSILLCLGYAYFEVTRSIAALGRPVEPGFTLWNRLLFVGQALRVISPPVFFLLVLLQPDVARFFKAAATRTI